MEALQRLHNRGSIGGYDIDNSLKLESDNTEYLTYTPSSTTNVKTWTFSCWVKRTELYNGSNTQHLFGHYTDGSNHSAFRFDDADVLELRNVITGNVYELKTDQVFRDTSAWYHIVIAYDTTQSTAADRTKVYVNGNQVTLSGTYTALNQITYINTSGDAIGVGTLANFSNIHFNGYMAEVHHIDGQQLAASDFGEFDEDTGIWKPKAYTGSYGTNGFYLDFENSASLGADGSGNSNNFTLSNITSTDQATDTPTNNFCTLNTNSALGAVNYIEGATIGITASSPTDEPGEASIMFNKGKWYYECQAVGTTDADAMFGLGKVNEWGLGSSNPGNDAYSFGYHLSGRVYYSNNSNITGWASYGTTDKIMVAIDHDNGFAYFGINGTWGNSGVPTSGATGTGGFNYFSNTSIASGDDVVFAFRIHYRANNQSYYNFGGYTVMSIASAESDANGYGTFEYAPPTGYYALCTKNLAEFG